MQGGYGDAGVVTSSMQRAVGFRTRAKKLHAGVVGKRYVGSSLSIPRRLQGAPKEAAPISGYCVAIVDLVSRTHIISESGAPPGQR